MILENDNSILFFIEHILGKYIIDAGLNLTWVYPEDGSFVTIEILERGPAVLESKTMGAKFEHRKDYFRDEKEDIVTGLSDKIYIKLLDNVVSITVYNESSLEAERMAKTIEDVIASNEKIFREHVDMFAYKGRLEVGFSKTYNDRRQYRISLTYKIRTVESYTKSDLVLKRIEINTKQ